MKWLRIAQVFLLAGALLIGAALPVAAGGGDSDNVSPRLVLPRDKGTDALKSLAPRFDLRNVKVIKGEIKEITGSIIKVDGKDIYTDAQTRYRVTTLGREGTLADLTKGMQIIALCELRDGKLYALQIVAIPVRPIAAHYTGKVTAFAYNGTADGSITIQTTAAAIKERERENDRDDRERNTTAAAEVRPAQSITFVILAGKFKVLPEGASVKVGDLVTVVAERDAQNRLIATGVVIHQPKPSPVPFPKLKKVSGVINAISNGTSANRTVTIGTTVLNWNDQTVFALRGLTQVQVGQQAIAFYVEKDGVNTARFVTVGIDLPNALAELKEAIKD